MKRAICLVAVTAIATLSLAQEKLKNPRSFPWDTLYYKNEVSLDVSPVITVLVGTFNEVSCGATYRRFFDQRNAFRIGYRGTFAGQDYSPEVEAFGYHTINPDSFIFILNSVDKYEYTHWHTLRTGMEHRFGKRRIKFVLGIDIITGIEEWQSYLHTSIVQTIQPYDTSNVTWYYPSTLPPPEYSDQYYRVLSFIIGVSPVIGFNLNLTRRWSLHASTAWDCFGYFPFKYSNPIVKQTYMHPRAFQFTAEAPMTDISVSYLF